MKSSLKQAVKLRGHHLICLHFFRGEGYDSEFVENLGKVLQRIELGEEIVVCSGADDVCKRCPYLKGGKCSYDKDAESEIGEMDRSALRLIGLETNKRIKWVDIKSKIPGIIHEWASMYCKDCDWERVCGLI